MFDYFLNATSHGNVLQMGRGEQRIAIAFPPDLVAHREVGSAVVHLQDAVDDAATRLAALAPDRSPEGLNKEAIALVERGIAPKFRLMVEAGHKAITATDAELNRLHTPRFTDDTPLAVRAERRSWARGLSLAQKLDAAKADPDLAAAIIEGGQAMSGLPADIFDRVRREVAVTQMAGRLGLSSDYRTKPTADDPIAGQPDRAATRKAAQEALEGLEATRETLGRLSPLLSSIVTAVALMTGETRTAAFERLSA